MSAETCWIIVACCAGISLVCQVILLICKLIEAKEKRKQPNEPKSNSDSSLEEEPECDENCLFCSDFSCPRHTGVNIAILAGASI